MPDIYLFTTDLRTHDNPNLENALKISPDLKAVYVHDTRLQEDNDLGFSRMGAFRRKFIDSALDDLGLNLKSIGIEFIVKEGNWIEEVRELVTRLRAERLFIQQPVATYESNDLRAVSESLPIEVIQGHDGFLVLPDEYRSHCGDVPMVFTQFRKNLQKLLPIKYDLTKMPSVTGHPPPYPNPGGESAALQWLDHYVWQKKLPASYRATRNDLDGLYHSTKFSPWLAIGSVSVRAIYNAIREYEGKVQQNKSTYWIIFELIWREYFRHEILAKGSKFFQLNGVRNWAEVSGGTNLMAFNKWKSGTTGEPLVDACMRQLAKTGWMSNRGRQIVGSYLVNELALDWRWGAQWFEYLLTDYDVASNYGNWMYLAGVGNDPRGKRKFNQKFQREKYDPKGKFIQKWTNLSLDI